jgi:hypothetical protein
MTTPRAQHYIPRLILKNFTQSGSEDEHLWVTSPAEKHRWRSLPAETGHQRGFYRIEREGIDPNLVENFPASCL